jgi:hypothetical protein
MEAVHAVLFNPDYNRQVKIKAYRAWLEKNQPCVFGKTAATNKSIYICLLEEHEILRMQRGDPAQSPIANTVCKSPWRVPHTPKTVYPILVIDRGSRFALIR